MGFEDIPQATPAAAELAASSGIELRSVQGTGADGLIVKGDVEKQIAAAKPLGDPPEDPPEAKAKPMAAGKTLDRSQPFGTCHGRSDKVVYIQNGCGYASDDSLVGKINADKGNVLV